MRIGKIEKYPWYQDLIACAPVIFILIYGAMTWSELPEKIAIHFDMQGLPNGFGSRAFNYVLCVGLTLFMWGITVLIRYAWLVNEHKKSFNWLQLIFVLANTLVGWSFYSVVRFNLTGAEKFNMHFGYFLIFVILMAALVITIEGIRRSDGFAAHHESNATKQDFVAPGKFDISRASTFYFMEQNNPRYWSPLLIAAIVAIIVATASHFFNGTWSTGWNTFNLLITLSHILAISFLLSFIGGFRFTVHPQGVDVVMGLFRIPLKHIPLRSINTVSVMSFSPLADFGGWGIRWGKDNTTGYILAGNRGVLIKTPKRNFLLAVRDPENFAGLLNQAISRSGN